MNKSLKKVVCGALASVMLLGTAPMARAATPFTDVPSDSWYVNFVDYAYNHKLMAGTSDTTFAPNQIMTRGMLATVIYSIAGKPAPSKQSSFTDIGNTWYTKAVDWCYGEGITAGTSVNTFSPNNRITREQMVVFMMRYAEHNGLDVSERAPLGNYSDVNRVSYYAEDAMSWAVARGLVKGTSSSTLSPKDGTTRAQCAVILQRFTEWLNGGTTEPEPTEPPVVKPEPQPTEPAPTEPPVTEPKPEPTEPPVVKPEPQPTEPKPEPQPPVHTHNWVHTHYDEVGHWEGESSFVCVDCKWTCTESQARNLSEEEIQYFCDASGWSYDSDVVTTIRKEGMDLGTYWHWFHQRPMLQEYGQQHSYTSGHRDYIVDTPAYDEWVCDCGEVTRTDPTVG